MLWTSGGSYRAWADHLDAWADVRVPVDLTLPGLVPADFAAETWTRLVERIRQALDRRLKHWSRVLTAAMAEASDEFSVGRALVQARAGLREIRAMAGHPGLPADLRDRLREAIDEQIHDAQRSLEQQVESMRRESVAPSLIEARLRAVRDSSLVAALDGPPPATGPDPWRLDPAARPRRRVITD
ncbi:hypothetical protein YW5DRAFT_03035 [Streptomyces sp. Ncost-T6T-1]|uniref:hypothetical protein n=1 Tax=Streptomyces sp. Ncost-T6T-1 TaxID=1100828 RepID=UPI000804AC44|nr:hypothetical protein [Streptomyces sp. Ncost-T6T-1]SBV05638.1 hypothetical protein YW5DRAFT_03035 [Streptomyces sp. Ncost-T6T-1]